MVGQQRLRRFGDGGLEEDVRDLFGVLFDVDSLAALAHLPGDGLQRFGVLEVGGVENGQFGLGGQAGDEGQLVFHGPAAGQELFEVRVGGFFLGEPHQVDEGFTDMAHFIHLGLGRRELRSARFLPELVALVELGYDDPLALAALAKRSVKVFVARLAHGIDNRRQIERVFDGGVRDYHVTGVLDEMLAGVAVALKQTLYVGEQFRGGVLGGFVVPGGGRDEGPFAVDRQRFDWQLVGTDVFRSDDAAAFPGFGGLAGGWIGGKVAGYFDRVGRVGVALALQHGPDAHVVLFGQIEVLFR